MHVIWQIRGLDPETGSDYYIAKSRTQEGAIVAMKTFEAQVPDRVFYIKPRAFDVINEEGFSY